VIADIQIEYIQEIIALKKDQAFSMMPLDQSNGWLYWYYRGQFDICSDLLYYINEDLNYRQRVLSSDSNS
jgi:hypothetical protein